MRAELGERGLRFDDARRVVAFEESGRRFEATNERGARLLGYRVNHELLPSSGGKACDYLLGVPQEPKVYLIELKGHHLRDAARQVRSTIARLGRKLHGKRVYARVVLSRVPRPDLRSSEVLVLERILAGYGGSLRYRSILIAESI